MSKEEHGDYREQTRAQKRELFQIGEVAGLFRLSVGALRHYEKMGLLQPEYIDPDSGYRYYSTRQFECLNTIRYLRALDVPLPKLADFMQHRNIDKIRAMLIEQKTRVVQKRRELQLIERKLDRRLHALEDALSSELNHIQLRQCPARRLAWIRNELKLSSYLDLESSLRQLERQQTESLIFLGKVGVGISREHLCEGSFERYDLVFLQLEEEDSYVGAAETLPSQNCVCVRFRGSHREAPGYYQRLCDFILRHHFEISGFSMEITMIDEGLTSDASQFVTEIQIPISLNE